MQDFFKNIFWFFDFFSESGAKPEKRLNSAEICLKKDYWSAIL